MLKEEILYYFAAGVFKIDFRVAGFPDLLKVAQEWAKDLNFHELIIRGVSDKNFGIQFVYIAQNLNDRPVIYLKNDLIQRFGKGLYAIDYEESTSSDLDKSNPYDCIVVMKPHNS